MAAPILGLTLVAAQACAQSAPLPPAVAYLDINSDGLLQYEEVGPNARRVFSNFDENENGSLEQPELGQYFSWAMAQNRDRRARLDEVDVEAIVTASGQSLQDLDAAFDLAVNTLELEGAVLLIGHGDEVVYKREAGGLTVHSVVPVASASKLFSGVVMLRAIDLGLLELNAPLSVYLPDVPDAWGQITIDQLFSMRSGAGDGHALTHDPRRPHAEVIAELVSNPPADEPGTVFRYEGLGMQLAGFALETQTGLSWQAAVDEWIAGPLGMDSANFVHPTWYLEGAEVQSPPIAAGLRISGVDYLKLLQMIALGGTYGEAVVMSPEAVSQLFIDRTVGLDRKALPPSVSDEMTYAFGTWCEGAGPDRYCPVISSAGAFGTYPWVDQETGLYGVFVTVDRNADVMPFSLAIRRIATSLLANGALVSTP